MKLISGLVLEEEIGSGALHPSLSRPLKTGYWFHMKEAVNKTDSSSIENNSNTCSKKRSKNVQTSEALC